MQCRYCEQNNAILGSREPELSFQRIPSSRASGAKAALNPSRSNACGGEALEEFCAEGTFSVERPLDAHEKEAQFVVLVLVGVEDVGASLVEQAGDAGHQTLLVRAVDQQNGCVFHLHFSLNHLVL